MQFDRIPQALRAYQQWVTWRSEQREASKPAKVPYHPTRGTLASVIDPQSWGTYAEAVAAFERDGYAGIGFVFTTNDPFAGIDLDDTSDDTEAYQRQVAIEEAFATWAPPITLA